MSEVVRSCQRCGKPLPERALIHHDQFCSTLCAKKAHGVKTHDKLFTSAQVSPREMTPLEGWWAKVQRDLKRQVKREGYHRNLPVTLSQGEANGEGTG